MTTIHDLFYVAGNAFVPTGVVTSTARRGAKWYNQAQVGDVLNLRITESEDSFGAAVVVAKELVTFADAIENSDHNHVADNPKYASWDKRTALWTELTSAYGICKPDEEFTLLHIVRVGDVKGVRAKPFAKAFAAVESENKYQIDKYGEDGQDHTLDEWVSYIRAYADDAASYAAHDDPEEALEAIRKVTTMGVVCLETHGAPHREGF